MTKFFIKDAIKPFSTNATMAERSKALVQDTNFFCDVGSNPTATDSFTFSFVEVNSVLKRSK